MNRFALATAILLAAAGMSHAQLVINEVFENPPNGGDQTWEYIEIYGPANYNLTGYAVVLIKGGEDNNPDDGIPDGSTHQKTAEIDEAFSLDGWRTDANGMFVLYNVGQFNATGLASFLTPNPSFQFFQAESPSNKRFLNGASFTTLFIPSVFDPGEIAGKLNNDGSSTYLLVRKRPNHALTSAGASVYLPGYAWAKDTSPDVDYNSRLDFGDEVPLYFSEGASGLQATAMSMEPVQIIDEIAWSNGGGKEYNVSGRGDVSDKFSQTPGFNPDAVVRSRYFAAPPNLGWAIDEDTNELKRRNAADESWLYGEVNNVDPGSADYGKFKPGPVDAVTPTELVWLAPTDPNGRTYSFQSTGPNPFVAPFFENSAALDPSGTLLVEPYNITGVRVTPGSFNDAPAGTPLASTAIAHQFRWTRGDFNFDGVVNCLDRALIVQAATEAWTLDDTATLINDRNTASTADDLPYTGSRWRLEGFNGLLAMIRMNLSDGSTGDWTSGRVLDGAGRIVAWGGAVTSQDLATFDAEFPGLNCNPPLSVCCVGSTCTLTIPAGCAGTVLPDMTSCSPSPCSPTGVCCRGATCNASISQSGCIVASGTAGAAFVVGTTCNSGPISNTPCCYADYNKAAGVSVQDIFDFLTDWFAGRSFARIGGDGSGGQLSVQNIFDFLAAWFAGGC